MGWYEEYLNEIVHKKKKKEDEEKKIFEDLAPVGSTYLTGGVPNSGTTPYAAGVRPEIAAPVKGEDDKDRSKWYEGYFKKGAFEDGFQKGDNKKAAVGTATDLAHKLLTGATGIVEGLIDTAESIAPVMMEQQFYADSSLYSEGEKKLYQESLKKTRSDTETFIKKDIVNEEAVARNLIAGGYAVGNPLASLWGGGRFAAGVGDTIKERYQNAMTYMADEMEENSLLDEKTDALVQSAGQLAVQMGMQAVGVPWWVTSAATAYGSEYEAALEAGAASEEATLSAMITAGAEVLTEQISGGIKFGGKTLDEAVTKAISRGISNKFLQSFAKLGMDVAGEGAEEVLTQNLSSFGQWLTYRSDEELKELLWSEEAMQAKIDAFVGGAVMGGFSSGGKAVMADARGMDYVSEMTKNEKAVVDRVYKDALAEEAKKAKDGKVTEARKREIYDEVLKQLDEGGFSIETIEEVLGGDTWKNYSQLRNYQQEYDKLYNMKYSEKSSKDTAREEFLKKQLEDAEGRSRLDSLKSRLGEEVSKLAQSDRLVESYNEQNRRGRKFEADVTQYAPKMRPTIQKAIDSGILNDRRSTHKFVELVAKITADKGVTFDFANNEKLKESGFAIEGKTVNGYVTAEGITLNIDSPRALNRVVGHEVTHVLEGTELYGELQEMLISMADAKGELQSRTKALEELYKGIEGADVTQELTAELVGDYLFSDTDFIQQLSTESPDLFDKVWKEIKYLCKAATAGSKEAKKLLAVQKKFEEVYRVEGVKNTVPEDGVRYALSDGTTKDASELSRSDLEYLLEDAQNGKFSDNSFIPLRRNTPEFFIGVVKEHSKGAVTVEDHPMAATVEHLRQNMDEDDGQSYGNARPHNLTIDDIVIISEKMGDPSYIVLQKNGRYAEVVSFYNGRNKQVVVAIDLADSSSTKPKNYKHTQYMNSYEGGYYNIIVTQYEPDSLAKYLSDCEIVYSKKEMNGKYQVGSGRVVTVTHDTPFIEDIIPEERQDVKRSLSSSEDIAPLPGEVYGKDVGLRTAAEDDLAPVREDLDNMNVPDSDTAQLQAELDTLARQKDQLEDQLNEMVNRGEFGESYDHLSNEWSEVNNRIRELEAELPAPMGGETAAEKTEIKLTKKATADIVREVRSILGLTNQQIADCREIIEAYRTGDIQSKEELVQVLQTQFGLFTEISRDQQLEEVKRTIRTRGIKVPEAVKRAIPDYGDIRRRNFGKVRLTENGMGIDEVYRELESLYPGYFNENRVSNPEDQLLQIITLANTAHVTENQQNRDAADVDHAAEAIVRAVNKAKWDQEQNAAYKALSDHDKALARIDRYLTQDKMYLNEEFEDRRREFSNREGWISRKARELVQELKGLKKGVKASPELGQLLDQESDWGNIRVALVNVLHTPGSVVNENSFAEAAVRELLNGLYETGQLDLEAEYQEKLAALEAEADEKRKAVETAQQRKVKHEEHTNFVMDLIGDTSTWVDKPLGIQYAINPLHRNLRDVVRGPDGKPDYVRAQAIYDAFGGEYNHHEAQMKKEDNRIKDWYKQQKINEYESVYIQMLGEFLHNPETTVTQQMVEEYYEEHKDSIDQKKVDAVIERARADYDALFERVNTVLRQSGMKEIPYRKGYFPHLKMEGKQSLLAKILDWKTQNNKIPTDIAGMTEQFEPTRSWQSFSKQRQGDVTEFDFRKGFDAYVHGALDWIYHIEDIQKRRAFENYIRYIHSDEGTQELIDKVLTNDYLNADEVQAEIDHILKEAKNPLGNFVTDFRTATNLLASKKHSMDRGMEQMFNRDVYSVASNISNRVSANMVAGSISAAASNFIPITQSWGEVDPRYTLVALKDAVRSIVWDDQTVEKSDFLTNRLIEEEKLDTDTWDKIGEGVGIFMTGADHLTSQTVWRSKYRQNLAQGMSEAEAIRNADQFAENLMAGRSRGNQPTLFEAKNLITKMLTAFQLEVNNQYGYLFKDMPAEMRNESKAKLAGAYMKVFAGAYIYNELSRMLTGRDMAFDPIRILQELIGGIADEEEDDSEDVAAFVEDVLEQTPFIGGLIGGGRVPISSALPYDGDVMNAVTGVAEASESGDWKAVLKELENPLYYLLPPMAGGQIRKTVQGLSMYPEVAKLWGEELPTAGSYTDSGALRFTVEDAHKFQAALFGQWANENAQQYIDEGRAPLQEKQMEEFLSLDIPIQQYWEYRDGLKGLKTVNEKADYIASLDLPVEKKNILINNIADRKNSIDLKDYDRYEDFAEMDFAVKKPELYRWLQSQGMTVKDYEKSGTAKKDAYSWAAQNPEKYNVSRAVTDDLVAYRVYTKRINSFEADKDADGNSISGSRKQKIVDYINGLDLDYGAKIILYRMAYSSDDTYNYEIVDYLNSRKDLTYNDMKTILEELGFAVDTKGNVTW